MPDGFERSAFVYRDLKEQPKGKFYLLLEIGANGKGTFAVDGVEESTNSIVGFVGGYNTKTPYKCIVQFNKDILWTLINADYLDVISMEEMVRREHADSIHFRALARELRDAQKAQEPDKTVEDKIAAIAVPQNGVDLDLKAGYL